MGREAFPRATRAARCPSRRIRRRRSRLRCWPLRLWRLQSPSETAVPPTDLSRARAEQDVVELRTWPPPVAGCRGQVAFHLRNVFTKLGISARGYSPGSTSPHQDEGAQSSKGA